VPGPARYRYRIRVEGPISPDWQEWFGGMHIHPRGPFTELSGELPDLAALYGVLNHLAGLNLPLVSLRRTPGSSARHRAKNRSRRPAEI
jgi:hypothetical protein